MSEQKHAPEPWATSGKSIRADVCYQTRDGYRVVNTVVAYVYPSDLQLANARRIVACVNACAGMSDEAMALAVENGGMKAVIGFARDLERQRDQLLEALKPILERIRDMDDRGPYGETWQSDELLAEIAAADAAIAAVEAAK